MAAKKRTKEQNARAYRNRIAKGLAEGKTRAEAAGQKNRDTKAEYDRKVARDVAAGRRKPPNRSAPRNRQAPTGARLTGHAYYGWPNAAEQAEKRTVAKLRSDRRVFLYAKVATLDPQNPALMAADIGIDQLVQQAPMIALQAIRTVGDVQDYALFPNGGIRADTLRRDAAAAGGLDALIMREVQGSRVRAGDDPTVNPANRKGSSGSTISDGGGDVDAEERTYILAVVVQWSD
jgi:hypothetical protein